MKSTLRATLRRDDLFLLNQAMNFNIDKLDVHPSIKKNWNE